jgi:hypothetical protein
MQFCRFKPFHDITTQAVDAEGNVLEGLYDKNGNLQQDKVFVLTRTYARAVAGTFVAQAFDLESAAFSVTYSAAAAASQMQSEIYLNPDYHYRLGYNVSFSPFGCCTWAMASKFIMLIGYARTRARVRTHKELFVRRLHVGFTDVLRHESSVTPGVHVTVSISSATH